MYISENLYTQKMTICFVSYIDALDTGMEGPFGDWCDSTVLLVSFLISLVSS